MAVRGRGRCIRLRRNRNAKQESRRARLNDRSGRIHHWLSMKAHGTVSRLKLCSGEFVETGIGSFLNQQEKLTGLPDAGANRIIINEGTPLRREQSFCDENNNSSHTTQLDFRNRRRGDRDRDHDWRTCRGSARARSGESTAIKSAATRNPPKTGQGILDARAAVDAGEAGWRLAQHPAAGSARWPGAGAADARVAPAAGLRTSHGDGDRTERHLYHGAAEGRLQTLHGRAAAPDRIFSAGPEHAGVGRYPGGHVGQHGN